MSFCRTCGSIKLEGIGICMNCWAKDLRTHVEKSMLERVTGIPGDSPLRNTSFSWKPAKKKVRVIHIMKRSES